MTYILVTLVAVLNCAALFFLSLLAVGGDGSTDGIHRVWLFGYPWIAAFTLAAYFSSTRGKRSKALGIAASTLPAGYCATLFAILLGSAFSKITPSSPEFNVACKTAGPHYIAKPTTMVESIAYDWEPGTYPPDTNYFEVDVLGNVSGLRGGLPRFPPPIKFVEGRCCQFEGQPKNRVGPFVRHVAIGEYFGIEELTADTLVTYKVSHVDSPNSKRLFDTVDMTVTDRRDGKELASLRYVLDQEGRRGCGAESNGVMDEQKFIRRAIGIN